MYFAVLRKHECGMWTSEMVVLVVKNLPVNAGRGERHGFDPGLGRSLKGGGHGNPLKYSCLENPMDRGVCQSAVHRLAQS